ncbi:hypothetical protein CWC19_11200 [Pseudoalteromonas aurantia]|uniref:DUF3080 domain-containing protein n=1 Tax=Pseudoalteromonas aurantia TaxID=43654 RepID=A0A5S3V838_9GAMM|nr:hypothetical protein CWC19_11200 [Pseudoalteromonas aurantia]
MVLLKLTLLSICIVYIAACSPQPSNTYVEYQQRLSSVVEKDAPNNEELQQLPHPNVDKPSSEVSLSIIEFASINHCKLSQLIAKKNNQLGKVWPASEALKYNIEFVQHVQNCLDDPQTHDTAIKNKLIAVKKEKQLQFAQSFEHMLFNEAELSQLTYLTASEIAFDRHLEQQTASLEALTALSNLQAHLLHQATVNKINTDNITIALQKLHKNKFIPKLITSTKQHILLNDTTTRWLNQIKISDELCPVGKNKKKAQILSNVFSKFYLEKLQPYQSQLTNMLEKASPLLFKLWSNHPDLAESFNPEHTNSLLKQMKVSTVTHVKWWQDFYKTCEIRP